MSFDFRASSLAKAQRRIAAGVTKFLRRDTSDRTAYDGPVEAPEVGNWKPSNQEPGPETFFDTDFLRKLERLHLVAKRLSWAGAEGEHTASRKGFSQEFSDYRRYQRGDDLRYIDWNIYRRLDRLLLKVFTSEEEMNIYLLVDTSRSMGEGAPMKLDYAKKVAAALGYIGLKNLDRVGGACFSTRVQQPLNLGRGRKQILKLFSFLNKLSSSGETDLRASVHAFTNLFPHPGFAIVISDLFDPAGWRGALEELRAKRYQLLVVHVVDEGETRPEPWGDVALIDVEGGVEHKLFLDAPMIKRFQEELANYFKEIETICGARGIDYLRTTTRVPFDEFVLRTLRQVSSVA